MSVRAIAVTESAAPSGAAATAFLARGAALAGVAAVWLCGCAPELDWREVRAEGTTLSALMPCRPKLATRTVALGEQTTRLSLLACKAGGLTWGVAYADVGEPSKVPAALQAMSRGTLSNLQGREVARTPLLVRGASAPPGGVLTRMAGQLPDGTPAQGRFALFAHGSQIFQATVVGPRVADEVAEPLFESLRVGR